MSDKTETTWKDQPNLLRPKEQVEDELRGLLDKAVQIRSLPVTNSDSLGHAQQEYNKLFAYLRTLVERSFSGNSIAQELWPAIVGCTSMDPSFEEEVRDFRDSMSEGVAEIESLIGRLPLFDDPGSEAVSHPSAQISSGDSPVFIVHGHDVGTCDTVARFVETLGVKVTILHEKPNRGRTIIEKLEDYGADIAFAVVLLTGDDLGAVKTERNNLAPRARQNVILELGYFLGKLGRARVCALYEQGVELPSDYDGVLYVELNEQDWKFKLARELKQAGLPVDLNKAV